MKHVIDTDIFIDFLRGYGPSKKWFAALDWESVLFSAVTEAELLSGADCNHPVTFKKTLAILQLALKIPVTNEVARKAGEIRRIYHLSLMDSFIAATALLNNAQLFTRNSKHFENVEGLDFRKPYN